MNLQPIGIDNQIQDAIQGASDKQAKELKKKIEFVNSNIDKIQKINGKKVFYPTTEGEYIYYHLQKAPKWLEEEILTHKKRKYYYPIQYASIEFKQ